MKLWKNLKKVGRIYTFLTIAKFNRFTRSNKLFFFSKKGSAVQTKCIYQI